MKGKKFLTMAATSLMACLVAGMGAMTYSKYITSDNTGTQQATAANWGFVVTVNADDLFASSFDDFDCHWVFVLICAFVHV